MTVPPPPQRNAGRRKRKLRGKRQRQKSKTQQGLVVLVLLVAEVLVLLLLLLLQSELPGDCDDSWKAATQRNSAVVALAAHCLTGLTTRVRTCRQCSQLY
jgi:hypothetical protein